MHCLYGQRCLFKHEERTLEEVSHYHYTYLMQELETLKTLKSGSQCNDLDSDYFNYDNAEDAIAMLVNQESKATRLQVFMNITESCGKCDKAFEFSDTCSSITEDDACSTKCNSCCDGDHQACTAVSQRSRSSSESDFEAPQQLQSQINCEQQ
jgi:hypothetical protein